MFQLFLNPAYAIAGIALISAPIIIHLINRMRFKRVRWAAMEFLLKSQKRNRRRLIIEQLILLALRCLLVVLAGFLIARFLGFSALAFFQPQNTVHVVVLDDTLSMTDQWKDENTKEVRTTFDEAKGMVRKIAKSASSAGSAQEFKVIRLSEPGTPIFSQRLTDQTLRELSDKLDELKPTVQRVAPLVGVEAAKKIFDEGAKDQRVLHLVSDFRNRDWDGPEAEGLRAAVGTLAQNGVRVFLVDSANKDRGESRQAPVPHENLAIVDLRPETRVAAEGMPVKFTVTIHNYTNVEYQSVFLTVKVDGDQRLEASMPIQKIRANDDTRHEFMVGFVHTGFNQITANLDTLDDAIKADNTRYAVIEVRKQVPVLVIDGDPSNGLKSGGDTFHVQEVFKAARGYQIVPRAVGELEKPNLEQYPCIYLLNVPQLSDKALKNLEEYVQNGGSVAFFLGEKVRPDYYNKSLYKDGKGLFPAPLADRPTQPLTDAEKVQRILDSGQYQIFLRDEKFSRKGDMPVFGEVAEGRIRELFKYLTIDRYFPVPRLKWNRGDTVQELVTLPNQRALDEYKDEAQRLLAKLPVNESKLEKYRPGLEEHQRDIRNALTGKYLYELSNALEFLLNDAGDPKDPKKPSMIEFWEQPDVRGLREEVNKFRERVQFGDPLVIANTFGKGRVVAFLTTAGRAWNDWAGGSPAQVTYPIIMLELHKYLNAVAGDNERLAGDDIVIQGDASRYKDKMRAFFQPEKPEGAEKAVNIEAKGDVEGPVTGGKRIFTFHDTKKPGLYLFDLEMAGGEPGAESRKDQRAYVVNVDPLESDLKRAARDDMEKFAGGGKVSIASASNPPEVSQRQTDLSESPWFYLVILAVLVLEQAMAVHLSFHLKGNEAALPAAVKPQTASAA